MLPKQRKGPELEPGASSKSMATDTNNSTPQRRRAAAAARCARVACLTCGQGWADPWTHHCEQPSRSDVPRPDLLPDAVLRRWCRDRHITMTQAEVDAARKAVRW